MAIAGQAASVGLITTANGSVNLRRASGGTAAVAKGASLAVNDMVSTGGNGRATILFNDGSQVRLNTGTSIQITPPHAVGNGQQSLFRAISGEVWARLRAGRAVQTRTAIAGVRGTEINLKVADDGTTALTVLEGEVHFFNEHGAVDVAANQQSIARLGQAPTAPITVSNSNLIVEWTLDLSRAAIPRERFYISLDPKVIAAELKMRQARVQAAPDAAAAHSALGDAFFDSRCYAEALREYEAALHLNPEDKSFCVRKGYALLELDRLDEARATFHAVVKDVLKPSVQAVADSSDISGRSGMAASLLGIAWAWLMQDKPTEAERFAGSARVVVEEYLKKAALGSDHNDYDLAVKTNIALGISRLRQPDRLEDALNSFQVAARDSEKFAVRDYEYQAHSWLSLVYLQQGNTDAALREGQSAIKLQSYSALAHGNLALAYLYSGRSQLAAREAKQAAAINPDSVAATLTLGQALLAQGDVEAGERAAARAVSLDPRLPQAHYLFGLANAQRRDYTHAARRLKESLQLAPNFLPAASLLATVYTRMGKPREAVAMLTAMEPRYPARDEVQAALGEVNYEQGHYRVAEEYYRKALTRKPNSALYYARLARLLADANRLNDAIEAGQHAVALAPEVAQYHALLGQIYDYARVSFQAEREYREAIALDPTNALARALLAIKISNIQSALDTFSQAFLYDPQVGKQIMRGGIATEFTPRAGANGENSLYLLHDSLLADGKLNFLGGVSRARDSGLNNRPNDDTRVDILRMDSTYVLKPPTNLYLNLVRSRSKQGLAGPNLLTGADLDAKSEGDFDQAEFALRHRTHGGHHLWLGLTYQGLRSELKNPVNNNQLPFPLPINQLFPFDSDKITDHGVIPEVRADFSLSHTPERPSVLTVGLAQARLHPGLSTGPLAFVQPGGGGFLFPGLSLSTKERFSVAYAQLSQRASSKLSFVAQLRKQRDRRELRTSGGPLAPGTVLTSSTTESHLLPGLIANYYADRKTNVRFFVDQQASTTNLALAPTDTRLTVEPNILATGSARLRRILELDIERQLPGRALLKLYGFHASGDNMLLGRDATVYTYRVFAPLTINRIRQDGLGLRYERPLSRNWQGQVGLLFSRSTADAPGQAFDGQAAPYYPNRAASVALNYIGGRGYKATFSANYVGGFFQDQASYLGLPVPANRPRFPARTYFNVVLAKEPVVDYELFAGVSNLFNQSAIAFNDVPSLGLGRRRIFFGVTRRYH